MRTLYRRSVSLLDRLGTDASDPEETRLLKNLIVRFSLLVIPAGVLWGAVYLGFGQAPAGYIPLAYSMFSLVSLGLFAWTHRYDFFRFTQLVLILLLPFLLMIALGGFFNSSAVILWSLFCPLSALLFDKPQRVLWWLAGYIGLLGVSGLIQPYVSNPHPLTLALITLFFVMNIATVSAIVIVLLVYFVRQ
jgi:guanylate cyclase